MPGTNYGDCYRNFNQLLMSLYSSSLERGDNLYYCFGQLFLLDAHIISIDVPLGVLYLDGPRGVNQLFHRLDGCVAVRLVASNGDVSVLDEI